MKMTKTPILVALAATMATSALHAGVNVSTNEPTERAVAFRVLDGKYITTAPSDSLNCNSIKIGTRAIFTIVDLNSGALTDGHEVRIRYTPNVNGSPDPTKSSYWREVKEGVRRGHDGDVFKIKRVDTKCALQTVSGSFVAAPINGGLLGVTNKLEAAMLTELVDLSSVKSAKKIPKDLPTLPVAASSDAKTEAQPPSTVTVPALETSTNQPPATGQSAPPPQQPSASP
jgi:hypothetical protein